MAGEAFGGQLVIVFGRRRRERIAERGELVPLCVEVVAGEGDVLDALAIIGAQIFLDLAAAARAFLVQRDADLAVGRGHRLRGQAGILALDVEIVDLAAARDPLVEGGLMSNAAPAERQGRATCRARGGQYVYIT